MCGIFCALSRHGHVVPDDRTAALLRNRGPDHTGLHQSDVGEVSATFLSTVLSLRGTAITPQPLVSAGSVLCWNGEAWSIGDETVTGSDSAVVFDRLKTCTESPDSKRAVIQLLSNIRGPYAIVFYDANNNHLYYGRDCLGRRSLLKKATSDGSLVLSSVCDNTTGEAWAEVEADGIYVVDLNHFTDSSSSTHIPHTRLGETGGLSFALPFPPMNRDSPDGGQDHSQVVSLGDSLRRSVALRTQHVREAFEASPSETHAAKIAILFSGGLDCTLLARLCHDLLPLSEDIDLLNVAFENPRIHSNLEPGVSPYELCPDRITGRSSHAELERVCPRRWRFIEVNVPYTETLAHRATVMALMHPHNTEMDLSISYALYFASRGAGLTSSPTGTSPYTTPARVLLSGLGADELFGGYQRHATAFARHSYTGLLDELALDFSRLGKRNLGRDDRVISHSGREARFPFLDESFIALALQTPVQQKCDFGRPHAPAEDPDALIEPAKRALRCLAWDLGLRGVAREKKRAIQFGARTAKMETGKTKGTHVLA
ncbi:asparagine synthetase domain-containing protein 1 [Boeremia exigua]|uniref:asparagine synthetase domain-containing protein 1 n=1 Tax=Boeremia exigua TaxID=749465 RepID=UPI001E8D10B1|nr:asparagine synthetase domain-containing protein 1 [Boeremia exigua]KAH6613923.1 asparagine synthetase domain-containing protein 1 [Boeremia exigua]